MVTKVNLNLVGEPRGVGGFVLCPRLLHEFAGPPVQLLKIHGFYDFDQRTCSHYSEMQKAVAVADISVLFCPKR